MMKNRRIISPLLTSAFGKYMAEGKQQDPELAKLRDEEHALIESRLNSSNHKRQMEEVVGKEKIGRNDPCPCRSGKKFKNCHLKGNQ